LQFFNEDDPTHPDVIVHVFVNSQVVK
jgi:hypothetical protein